MKHTINEKQHPILIDEALTAIERYKAHMLKEHHVKVTTNGAINALLITGWQYIVDAKEAQKEEAA